MADSSQTLTDLSGVVADNVRKIDEFFQVSNLPALSFGVDGSARFPVGQENVAIHDARRAAMKAAKEIHDLLWTPEERMLAQFTPFLDMLPLQAMHRFGILEAIPRNGSASYEDIAATTRLHPVHLRRLLRLSMATGFFDETQDGKVCHNACSAMLLSRPHLLDIVGFMSEITSKASTRLIDAMGRDPLLQEPNTTGFNLAFQTDENFLLHLESNPKAAAMFGGTMKGMANNPGFSHDHMVRGYKWEELGNSTVVDVGGSSGHTCVALAKAFPSLRFVIQDFASAMEHAKDNIEDESVRNRIEFMTHDFFTPQPQLPDAKVYLLRWILHDWPAAYCLKILRNLTAGMAAGSSIIIAEVIMPPRGVLPWPEERFIASQDIIMMLLHNSQERTLDEYKQLMADANPRLHYVNHTTPENSIMSFIEFGFH